MTIQTYIDEQSAQLDSEEPLLEIRRLAVDQDRPSSVSEFNREIAQFNACARAVDAASALFNERCANRSYYRADLEKVREDLGLLEAAKPGWSGAFGTCTDRRPKWQ